MKRDNLDEINHMCANWRRPRCGTLLIRFSQPCHPFDEPFLHRRWGTPETPGPGRLRWASLCRNVTAPLCSTCHCGPYPGWDTGLKNDRQLKGANIKTQINILLKKRKELAEIIPPVQKKKKNTVHILTPWWEICIITAVKKLYSEKIKNYMN